jgi:hypothetical protein
MSEPSVFACSICGRQPVAQPSVINPGAVGIYCSAHPQNYGHGRTPSAACESWNARNMPARGDAVTVRP